MIAVVAIFAMMAFTASVAFAADSPLSLAVVDNEDGTASIVATGTGSVAGAAFTVKSDVAVTVTSDFFDTFAAQKFTTDDGLDAEGKVEGFDKALVTNDITGGVMVAAANATAKDISAGVTLFTLTAASDATITIEATNLNNTDAGYDADGEDIDLLIGADDGTYPVMLAASDVKTNVTAGTLTALVEIPGAVTEGDDTVDVNDVLLVLDFMFGVEAATDAQSSAADVAEPYGTIDVNDVLGIINIIFGGK